MLMTPATRFRYTVRYTSRLLNLLFLKVIQKREKFGESLGNLINHHIKRRCIYRRSGVSPIIEEVPQSLATWQTEVDGFSINYYDGCYVNTRD